MLTYKEALLKATQYFNGEELPASVFLNKYALKDPKTGLFVEATPDDMHSRLADAFHKGVQLSKVKKNVFRSRDDIYDLLKDFKYIVPQGSVMSQLGNNYQIGSLSNCFVIGQPYDSYGGIFQKDQEQVQLMKRRGGVGIDISTLRPVHSKVSNAAGSSTGAVSFMHRFSNSTREVAQNGRRGALMLSMDIRHPESLEFAQIKQDLNKITGANISLFLTDDFMQAVELDRDFVCRFPVNSPTMIEFSNVNTANGESKNLWMDINDTHSPFLEFLPENQLREFKLWNKDETILVKKVKARKLWEEIIKCAHNTAEPGLMFIDKHLNYSPDGAYEAYRGVTTNPCFKGDMKILTPSGYQTFESLENQECELLNKNGDIVKGTVWSSGIKEIVKVNTWHNTQIYCTKDHIFLTTENEEVKAIDLQGKRLMPYYTINSEINEYVKLGFLQGDGNLTRFSSANHLGLEINIGEKDSEIGELFDIKNNQRSIYIQGYNELLTQLKFSDKVLPERELPKTFPFWKLKDQEMFFKGMYSANGSIITNQRIAYKTTCKELAYQITDFLSTCGISSYITINKEKNVCFSNGQYLCKESYDINISQFESIKIFAEKIGFVHKYKKDSLEQLILEKAPKVRNVVYSSTDKVFDFNLQDSTHWGIVEGVIVHNCSEIFMQPYDACRLICMNLLSCVTNPYTTEAELNLTKLYEIAYKNQLLADTLVDLEVEKIQTILTKVQNDPDSQEVKQLELDLWSKVMQVASNSRRTGTGFTALGDMLAALNLKYDSPQALKIINLVVNLKTKAELNASIDLAEESGAFYGWDAELEKGLSQHSDSFYYMIKHEFPEEWSRMQIHGRRNVSWSTVAPTGTVSLMTQTTSGIEPLFAPYYFRKKKVNPNDEGVRVDETDQNGDTWMQYPVAHPQFKVWYQSYMSKEEDPEDFENLNQEDLTYLYEKSPWYQACAPDIDWIKRVEIQSIIQKYTSHSISSTINLPNKATVEDVANIYLQSWKKGLKGITVYRDGCRAGVLTTAKDEPQKEKFVAKDAPKRPECLSVDIYTTTSKGTKWNVIVGLYEGKPYEVFTIPHFTNETSMELCKKSKGKYDLENEKGLYLSDITSDMTSEEEVITRLVSTALRHGADITFIIEQLNKSHGDITSFSKAIARTLKKYANQERLNLKSTCTSCGSENIVFEEGCNKCLDCGHSGCS
jgi:ribonucleotide reductase alpha subunit